MEENIGKWFSAAPETAGVRKRRKWLRDLFALLDLVPFRPKETPVPRLAGDTHSGLVRSGNEDCFLYVKGDRTVPTAVLVADGIGGHRHGDIASGLLVRLFLREWRKFTAEQKEYSLKTLERFLKDLFLFINNAIAGVNEHSPEARPMGTTLVAAVYYRNFLISFHAGDSRTYLVRKGRITQLTLDHSAERSPHGENSGAKGEGKNSSPNEPSESRHVITRAMGMVRDHRPEYNLFSVKKGDRFLLCSDGLFLHLSSEEIGKIVKEAPTPAKAAATLLNTALQRGGRDNVTTLCAFF
ncbi:MAG: serine/threonine-protein phosphatase [Lentisphaeria bacterium]|nr:serine/threonine-protein phosphatase [Lentisphaeria bacterium]